ncbi:hypothetical protein [Oceanicella sp. SM1341]|uniref:hypothetical protein n=1 Tax=Oceanicella sp. SM1341 TaxID=1548889 RepID=UPI00130054EE|nr:hypothetical protein [Oceanicella sp. SM1341]
MTFTRQRTPPQHVGDTELWTIRLAEVKRIYLEALKAGPVRLPRDPPEWDPSNIW